MPDSITFTPASQVTERHALVIALEAPPNSGKTFSGCRLAKGMAEAQGKRFAVIDTEGGRTLHLRNKFDFDVTMMQPPHRPQKYYDAARAAQAAGYGALLIDSFSNVWRGIGGVLHWTDEELDAYVDRQRKMAEAKNWRFDEDTTRFKGKQSALIRPKTAFKFMLQGLLDLRMPIVLSVRGEVAYDAEAKKELFKLHMQKGIAFDVTCRFRLMPDRKGVIDISDSEKFKMEGDHAAIFKNGALLTEAHGEALEAWSRNAAFDVTRQKSSAVTPDKTTKVVDDLIDEIRACTTEEQVEAIIGRENVRTAVAWMVEKRPDEHKRLFEASNGKRRELRAAKEQAGG